MYWSTKLSHVGAYGFAYWDQFPDYGTIEQRSRSLYPELYHNLYPLVERVLNEKDDPWRYPIPCREMVVEWTQDVYRRWERAAARDVEVDVVERRLLVSLITIIFLEELLRRRRQFFR